VFSFIFSETDFGEIAKEAAPRKLYNLEDTYFRFVLSGKPYT
jgi:hypothetical protein